MGDVNGCSISLHSYEERLRSFANWPSSAPIGKESLARAGFVYEGTEAKVHCFLCRVKCDSWNFGDTAIRRHKELRPDCPFVKEHTDVLTDSSSMQVDPPQMSPPPPPHFPLSRMMYTQVDHGRGPVSAKIAVPEFHRVWPNHSSMNKESERTKTYAGWPVTFIRAEDMARAGFVFLKQGDRVQCVFCHGIVAEWEPNDNPFLDHLKHFPRCSFIKGSKCNNISIEDEVRGVPSPPLELPRRPVDECGHEASLSMEGYEPEMTPPEWYNRPNGPNHSLQQMNVVEHQPSKHIAYATREARKDSYSKWPENVCQDVAALVDAGFFYTGTTDSVKCFQCGGGLKNWEPGDKPWEEHARWFPDCQYVALNKGREYVEISKKNKPPIFQPNSDSVPEVEVSPSTSESTRDISEAELDTLMNQDMVKTVLEFGLDRNKVRRALEIRMRKAGYSFPDSEALANAALEIPDFDGNEKEMEEPAAVEETNSSSVQVKETEEVQSVPKMKSNERESREDDLRMCKVCMDREMNVVFLPCGHFVACVDCASVMDNCPVCRTKIKGNVKTYWP